MEPEQLQLLLTEETTAEPSTLASPWVDVSLDLLAIVWRKMCPLIQDHQTRVRFQLPSNDHFEVGLYPFGWAITATGHGNMSEIGSCMSAKTLTQTLRKFIASLHPEAVFIR